LKFIKHKCNSGSIRDVHLLKWVHKRNIISPQVVHQTRKNYQILKPQACRSFKGYCHLYIWQKNIPNNINSCNN